MSRAHRLSPKARLALIGGIFLVLLAINHFWLGDAVNEDLLRSLFADSGPAGILLFIAFFCVGELMQVPGMVFIGAAVLLYGRALGITVGFVGALASVIVSFVIIRRIGGHALAEIEHPFLKRVLSHLDERPITTIILLRVVLWISPPLNYALALSKISFSNFVIGSAIGLLGPVVIVALLIDVVAGLL